jgi:hypothetical protein
MEGVGQFHSEVAPMTDPITATTSRKENRERWRGLVAEQRGGRKSKRAFCRERGISYAPFLAWSKRFAEGDKSVPSAGPMEGGKGLPPADVFCEVRVGGASAPFEIAVGGVVVRVSAGFDEADLARLLRVVGGTVRGGAASASGARVASGAVDELPGGIACSRLGIAEAARPC